MISVCGENFDTTAGSSYSMIVSDDVALLVVWWFAWVCVFRCCCFSCVDFIVMIVCPLWRTRLYFLLSLLVSFVRCADMQKILFHVPYIHTVVRHHHVIFVVNGGRFVSQAGDETVVVDF